MIFITDRLQFRCKGKKKIERPVYLRYSDDFQTNPHSLLLLASKTVFKLTKMVEINSTVAKITLKAITK